MKKILLMIMLSMLMISMVSAAQDSLGTYAKDDCIDLIQICGTCTYNNVTSVILPNSTRIIVDGEMTKRGMEYNYTFCDTERLGEYLVNGVGDLDGTDNAWAYILRVTENGREEPTENIVVAFSILFFLVFIFLIYGLLTNLVALGELKTDLKDVIVALVSYVGILSYYYFANIYFPKDFVMGILDIFLWVGGFTHLLLPLVALLLSWLKNRRVE